MESLAVSPCSNPEVGLDEVLQAYATLGSRKFEVFTSWAKSAFDYHGDPEFYLEKGRRHGMAFVSMHLPPVGDDVDASLAEAVEAARFAAAIGAGVVLFKATSRPNYIRAAGPFPDAVEELPVTPVLQNHAGTPITTLQEFREVLDGIDDERIKALLEVGISTKSTPSPFTVLRRSLTIRSRTRSCTTSRFTPSTWWATCSATWVACSASRRGATPTRSARTFAAAPLARLT